MKATRTIAVISSLTFFALSAAFAQEADPLQNSAPKISLVPIAPGEAEPINEQSAHGRAYADDPEMIAAGKQLYQAFNCVGCHFNGGGGMGPPLMDNKWLFGSEIEHIAASIREGRPGGMPSFRTLAPEEQIWQLSAYVKSLSQGASAPEGSGSAGTGDASRKNGGKGGASENGSNP
jgi:cytochrome c oxidase cbb3-type subunit III